MLRHRQRGQATVWLVGLTLVLGLLFGLASDGAVLFATQRRAQLVADSAARTAASQLDLALLRNDPGGLPRLDPMVARAAAIQYVADQEPTASAEVMATQDAVLVRVHLHAQTTLAHLPNQSGVDVVGEGTAQPLVGLAGPGQ
jgi:hypothetical protein